MKKSLLSLLVVVITISNVLAQSLVEEKKTDRANGTPVFQSGALLWDNTNISVGTTGIVSTELGGRPPDSTVVNTADDFEVPSGVKWSIDSIYAEGFISAGTTINPDAFAVAVYEDVGGMPGALLFREDIVPAGGINPDTLELALSSPLVLQPGSYWLSIFGVYNAGTVLTSTRWNWFLGSTPIATEAHLQDSTGIFGGGVWIPWTPLSVLGVANPSCFFAIYGQEAFPFAQPGVCYASTGGGGSDPGSLLTINLNTGVGTLIGPTGLGGVPGLAINSNGEMFGTERITGDLYRIDASTGAATLVGSTGLGFLDGIAFSFGDVLYGVDGSFDLYTIDTQTATPTLVGNTGDVFTGLAFDPTDGTLYASVGGFGPPANPDAIATIDTATGAATIVGTTGLAGTYGDATPDLHFDQAGNLYGIKGEGGNPNVLIAVDKSTGAGTVIGDSIGFRSVSGLASLVTAAGPAVPQLIYHKFDEVGSMYTINYADPATRVNDSSAVMGGLTMGGAGQTGAALIGSGGSSSTDFVNTNWATSLTGDWTISMWLNNLPSGTALNYLWGDNTAGSFRAFYSGAAGEFNVLVRRGIAENLVLVTGVGPGPSKVDVVYDSSVPEIRAYVNGALNNTVVQTTPLSITGTGPFKIGGYSTSTGMPSGSLMDEFKIYTKAIDVTPIAKDYAVEEFVDFPTALFADSTYDIKAKVRNLGADAQSNVPVRFFVDGAQSGSDILVSLASGDSATVTYSWTPSPAGMYDLTIASFLTGDEVPGNDSLTTTVDVQSGGPPSISVSPDSFDVTLTPTQIETDSLTIFNNGFSPLDFMIAVEGVTDASVKVDIIADESARSDKIIAFGKEVPLERLKNRNVPFRTQIPASIEHMEDIGEPVDKGAPSKTSAALRHVSRIGSEGVLLGNEEIFGSTQNAFGPSGARGRGNLFECTNSTTLLEHRLYLNITAATNIWFAVYEGSSVAGTYILVSASNVSPQGPGEGWYSSGPISVPMVAGMFYMIFPLWEAAATYYNEQAISPYPIPASFGQLIAGVGWHVAPTYVLPPPPTQDGTGYVGDPVAYYQTIVTGAGTSWLSLDATSGSVAVGDSMDILVTFNGAGLVGGDYDADIVITSDDPLNPEVRVQAHLFVVGQVSIRPNPDSLAFPPTFVNGTDTVGLWVANDGNGVLNVTDITSSNNVFRVDTTQFDVPPFDSVQVNVVFMPDMIGIQSGMLTVSSNDTSNPMLGVYVQGEGIAAPIITVTPDTVTAQVQVGDSVDVVIQIDNNGGSPLSWSASLGAAIANTGKIPVAAHADADARGPIVGDGSAGGIFGIGDLLAEFDLDTITGNTSHLGVEYFDGHFWVTSSEAGSPPNFLHKITESGQLVQSYSQPTTTWGWRDLAHDGTYLYGSVSPDVEQIDPATGQPTGMTIPGPTNPNRALAYDPATDHFWTMNFQSDLWEFDRSGTVVNTFSNPLAPLTQGAYGAAWDVYSEVSGGPSLWLNAGVFTGDTHFMAQVDPTTGTLTGTQFPGVADHIAGGLAVADNMASFPGMVVLIAIGQTNSLTVWDLAQASTPPFIRLIGPTSGTINPGDVGALTVRLYGVSGVLDTTLTANIVMTSNDPVTPVVNIPVTLDVITGVGDEEPLPTTFAVSRNYPNPFNPATTINYDVPTTSEVKLVIYNVLGQRVRTLVNGIAEPGRYKAVWDGANDFGLHVGSGTYLYRFEAGKFVKTEKMVLLK